MKKYLIAAMLVTTSAGFATAADMRMPVKAPPPVVAVYNWTGFYIGGNAGYSWGRGRTDQDDIITTNTNTRLFRGTTPPANEIIGTSPFAAPTGVFPINTTATTLISTSGRANVDGFVGGGQFGYNWQVSPRWVLGLEADFQGSTERGSFSVCGSTLTCGIVGESRFKLDWFGTVRGRAGFLATDRVWIYGTGGLAYGHLRNDYTSGSLTGSLVTASTQTTRVGWTAGGGVEGALDRHWTLRLEYLYMDLGRYSDNLGTGNTVTSVGTTSFGTAGPTTVTTSSTSIAAQVTSKFVDHILRAGVNYRF